MASVDELLAKVYAAPPGPGVAAFLDYDGTVISGFSATDFYLHRLRRLEVGPLELVRTLLATARGIRDERQFRAFLDQALEPLRGRSETEMSELGQRLFKHHTASNLHHEVWRLAEAHRQMGHTLVLASSATRFQVEPMAQALDADHVLCTGIEVVDGRLTGAVSGSPLWGEQKARAVVALAQEHDLDLDGSFAYSNGDEDLPFLQTAGNPVAVEPEDGLAREAQARGWPVLRCHTSGGLPGPLDAARTLAFYGGLLSGFGFGAGIGVLRLSRSAGVDIAGGLGADLGLGLAAIDVEVVAGQEHLWSSRPCVFVFNHQSKIDPIIVMKLLRGGFTGVGKAEAKRIPVFGQLFQLAGVAFVERGNIKQAKAALQPAVDKIRDERMSLVIAPEGTRSATPRLGPFKSGAFHIAMQASVPVVPIVMRNAGEVMWRGAQTVRAGRVEVAVLPPVDTRDWRRETVKEHAEEVRQMFVETLERWPGAPAAPVTEASPA